MVHPWRPFPGPVTTTLKSKLGLSSAFLRVLIRDGKAREKVTDFIFLSSRITGDSDCSYEIKKTLAPWKRSCDRPRQCIKKQRNHFADKDPYSRSYSFPVVMYGCESWTIKKAEHQRIDAFEL